MSKSYITEDEVFNCNLVKKLMSELFDRCEDMCLVQAEQFGFQLLEWFDEKNGFDSVTNYTEGKSLLEDLLDDLKWSYVYKWGKEKKLSELSDLELWDIYPQDLQKRLNDKCARISDEYASRCR